MAFPFLVVLAEWKGQRTGDLVYTTLARRWAKAIGVLFAVGAVSGTILSFEFGILWPRWMGRFGDVMGLPFAIEGFAFFLEAIFIGIYLYGWDRLPPRVHLWAGIADRHRRRRVGVLRRRRERLDERPDGLHARRERQRHRTSNPWAAMFNSALWPEATHMILAAFIVGGCLVAMPYAWAMLRGRAHALRARRAAVAVDGRDARGAGADRRRRLGRAPRRRAPARRSSRRWKVCTHTDEGRAARTSVASTSTARCGAASAIPDGLSILAFHDPHAVVHGARRGAAGRPAAGQRRAHRVPADGRDRHRDARARRCGCCSRGAGGASFRGRGGSCAPSCSRARRRCVALECGWVTTEVGRQPWIVWHVMRVRDAVTDAPNIRFGYFLLARRSTRSWRVFTVIVLRRLMRAPLPDELRRARVEPSERA